MAMGSPSFPHFTPTGHRVPYEPPQPSFTVSGLTPEVLANLEHYDHPQVLRDDLIVFACWRRAHSAFVFPPHTAFPRRELQNALYMLYQAINVHQGTDLRPWLSRGKMIYAEVVKELIRVALPESLSGSKFFFPVPPLLLVCCPSAVD